MWCRQYHCKSQQRDRKCTSTHQCWCLKIYSSIPTRLIQCTVYQIVCASIPLIWSVYLFQLLMAMAWLWLSLLWMAEYTWGPSLSALLIERRRRKLKNTFIVERWEPTQMVLWKTHFLYWAMPFSWSGLGWCIAIHPTQTYSTGEERQGLLTREYDSLAFPMLARVLYSVISICLCMLCATCQLYPVTRNQECILLFTVCTWVFSSSFHCAGNFLLWDWSPILLGPLHAQHPWPWWPWR